MLKLLAVVLALSFSLAAAPVAAQARPHHTAKAKSAQAKAAKSKKATPAKAAKSSKGKKGKAAPARSAKASKKAKNLKATRHGKGSGVARSRPSYRPYPPSTATYTRPGDILRPNSPRD